MLLKKSHHVSTYSIIRSYSRSKNAQLFNHTTYSCPFVNEINQVFHDAFSRGYFHLLCKVIFEYLSFLLSLHLTTHLINKFNLTKNTFIMTIGVICIDQVTLNFIVLQVKLVFSPFKFPKEINWNVFRYLYFKYV